MEMASLVRQIGFSVIHFLGLIVKAQRGGGQFH